MTSARESALGGLFTKLETVVGPTAKRNNTDPLSVPSGGLINLQDGDPGEPETTLSPLTYHYAHQAEIEVLVQGPASSDRDALLDSILQSIGVVIAADYTLGGKVEHCEVQAPETEGLPIEGAAGIKGAVVPVILFFSTTSPI